MYCPKCGSRLYSDDEKYMQFAGVCSGCVTYDKTPDKRFQSAYHAGLKAEQAKAKKTRKGVKYGR